MHATGGVDLGLELAGNIGELGTLEDVEVVVGGVAAGVALGADGGTCERKAIREDNINEDCANLPKMIRYSVILA